MNAPASLSINHKTANSIITDRLNHSQQQRGKTERQKLLIKDAENAVLSIKDATNNDQLKNALRGVDGKVHALKIDNLKTDARSVLRDAMLILDTIKDSPILKNNSEALALLNKLASDAKKWE